MTNLLLLICKRVKRTPALALAPKLLPGASRRVKSEADSVFTTHMQLRSSIDGDAQLFELSEPTVQLSQTLTNVLEDTANDAPVPVPISASIC